MTRSTGTRHALAPRTPHPHPHHPPPCTPSPLSRSTRATGERTLSHLNPASRHKHRLRRHIRPMRNPGRPKGNCQLRCPSYPEFVRVAVLNSAGLEISQRFVRMPLPLTFHCMPLCRPTPVAESVREMAWHRASQLAGQTGFSPLQLPHLPASRRSDLTPFFRRAALRARRSMHPNLQQQKFNPAPQNERNHA